MMAQEVVVVTGASSGIGEALAVELARRGSRVVLVARRLHALESVAARCPGGATPIAADVTVRAEVAGVVQTAIAAHGHIDVWINNVGQGITRPPSELTDDDIDDMMRLNVKSAMYGMQEVLPHFKARGRGHIINVSSMLGRVPSALFRSAYSGAKHFLNAITAMLRTEIQQTHPEIQVSLVSPGIVRTEFGLNARHGGPDSRHLPESQSAEEVAIVIADVVRTRQPDVYTRAGSKAMVVNYFGALPQDPGGGTPAA
jgi:short-subunit dehydrogenase